MSRRAVGAVRGTPYGEGVSGRLIGLETGVHRHVAGRGVIGRETGLRSGRCRAVPALAALGTRAEPRTVRGIDGAALPG